MIAKIKYLQARIRKLSKRIYKNPTPYIAGVLSASILVVYTINMANHRLEVDPDSYRSILNLIAKAESKDNYNAYFGNASNSKLKFTKMTISEVLDWQQKYVSEGSPSSAVGRYQMINTTLNSLVEELGVDKSQKFDESMQDELAIALLEKRGSVNLVNGEIDNEQFAAEIAKEWAGLPRVVGLTPEQSYYDGDGLNTALVDVKEVLRAVDEVKPK